MKVVFDTKPNSGYDDTFDRNHFPTCSNCMAAALAARDDWIVLREPRRNGERRAYIAVARALDITPNPLRADHAQAWLRDYLAFDVPAPFVGPDGSWETPLRVTTSPELPGLFANQTDLIHLPGDPRLRPRPTDLTRLAGLRRSLSGSSPSRRVLSTALTHG